MASRMEGSTLVRRLVGKRMRVEMKLAILRLARSLPWWGVERKITREMSGLE